eukprot:752753-Hanusia_phi.AAC.2
MKKFPRSERTSPDVSDRHHTYDNLRVSIHKVTSNFADFGLASSQVSRFLVAMQPRRAWQIEYVKGWFHDTMYTERIQNIESIALLRLDGDLYQSTIEASGLAAELGLILPAGAESCAASLGMTMMVQARSAVIDFHRDCMIEDGIHVGEDGLAWWRKATTSSCG